MIIPKISLAQTVIQLCKFKGIRHIVISPGSRNAPLTIGFTNDPFFKCYSIIDERSAAFFAMGIAQQINHPVALVCTSGSALLNYFPAVAEAYYSDIPLVVLSADRPKHLVGIGDGQTIEQKDVYGSHVKYATDLRSDKEDHKSIQDHNEEQVNMALNTAITESGPVHINCPFNEPLYETVDSYSITPKMVQANKKQKTLNDTELNGLISIWNSCKRKMILVGVSDPDVIDQVHLDKLAKDKSVMVFTETTSNLHQEAFFPSIDQIIAPLNSEGFNKLQPELLVTIGGMIVSKKIKALLRAYKPDHHWHIDENKANDTFFCLDTHLQFAPNKILSMLLSAGQKKKSHYQEYWQKVKAYRLQKHNEFLREAPFSDLSVFKKILESLPDLTILHLGNSSTIRYTQLFEINKTLKVFCNRGTSGIDGSTSTAIGSASVSNVQNVLITGDLSFFYDSNALWNEYVPSNFRIILINNSGGGIFRILPGHRDSDTFDRFFETTHARDAKIYCDMYGIDYISASNHIELLSGLDDFYSDNEQPKLLEIFTPRTINDKVLKDYFEHIK